jgi:ParB family transcriptional regulator, chromosome partitioning protein
MNAIIRPSVSKWLTFDQIDFPANARPTNATDVGALVRSIRTIGLQVPLTVIERDSRYVLIAGRHRLEALRVIGEERVPARVVDFDDIEARLWTISENLHRTELTALQRSEQIAEFARLSQERSAKGATVNGSDKVGQVAPVSERGGRGNEGGLRAAARELGIEHREARRSVKIDSIIPAAKEAAREAGLDRNQSALLRVASYADEDQVGAVADIAKARAEKAHAPRAAAPVSPRPSSLRNLENLAAGEFARWIKLTTPNDRTRVIRMLRACATLLADELQAGKAPQHIAPAAMIDAGQEGFHA